MDQEDNPVNDPHRIIYIEDLTRSEVIEYEQIHSVNKYKKGEISLTHEYKKMDILILINENKKPHETTEILSTYKYRVLLECMYPMITRFIKCINKQIKGRIVIAGESAARPFYNNTTKNKYDVVNLYIVDVEDEVYLNFIIQSLLGHVNEESNRCYGTNRKINYILKSGSHFSIMCKLPNNKFITYKLHLVNYPTISSLVYTFGVGASRIAYDGETLYASRLGMFSNIYKINLITLDLLDNDNNCEKQLTEYFHAGYSIGLMHIDMHSITNELIYKDPTEAYCISIGNRCMIRISNQINKCMTGIFTYTHNSIDDVNDQAIRRQLIPMLTHQTKDYFKSEYDINEMELETYYTLIITTDLNVVILRSVEVGKEIPDDLKGRDICSGYISEDEIKKYPPPSLIKNKTHFKHILTADYYEKILTYLMQEIVMTTDILSMCFGLEHDQVKRFHDEREKILKENPGCNKINVTPTLKEFLLLRVKNYASWSNMKIDWLADHCNGIKTYTIPERWNKIKTCYGTEWFNKNICYLCMREMGETNVVTTACGHTSHFTPEGSYCSGIFKYMCGKKYPHCKMCDDKK